MSLAALSVVVVASVLHAVWNLFAKRASGGGWVFVFAYDLCASLFYAPWVLWLATRHDATWSLAGLGCVVLSGLVHLAYGIFLQRGYHVADLSVVYPVARGTGPVLSSFAAFVVLGETPTATGLFGLAGVVLGIFLIASRGSASIISAASAGAGLRWGLATGAAIAAYTVIDALAVTRFGMHPVIVNIGSNMVQAVLLAPLVIRNPVGAEPRMQGMWRLAAAVGILSPLAYILVLTALKMGAPLSAVAPVREMSMMIGAFFGMTLLQEPVGARRLLGCVVMIAGVVLLSGR
jgi:drug/metabolite transporter (DMT)-like permease